MKLGIRTKIIIFAVLISFALGLILTGNSIVQQKNILINELKKRGFSLSRSLASGCVLDVLLEDKESLQEMIRKIKEKEDVIYIVIEDNQMQTLAKIGNYIGRNFITTDREEINFFNTEQGKIYEFTVPILTTKTIKKQEEEIEALGMGGEEKPEKKGSLRKIGTVKLGISLESIRRATGLLIKRNLLLILIVTGLSTYLIFSFLSRMIVIPLIRMSTFAERVAKNADLTQKIDISTKDEIGQLANSFNKIIDSLYNIVRKIRDTADKVVASSEELSSFTEEVNASNQEVSTAVQQITKGTNIQSTKVDETFQIMERASTTLKQVVASAQSITAGVSDASSKAEGGRKAAEETVEKVTHLAETVDTTAKVIQGLGKMSQQIGEITETITSIADQTNLLALNAAIEAARAGEAGRGFAVVAEEIRKLAEGSAESVRKIGNLIKSIQMETNKAVGSIEESTIEVEKGKEAIGKIANSLVEINNAVREASVVTTQISHLIQEQIKENEKVNIAMKEVTSIAKESAASTQEVSSSIEEQTASVERIAVSTQQLTRLAAELMELVNQFKLKEDIQLQREIQNAKNQRQKSQ
ncbi:MAG: hypothetical protein B6D55_02625 [Candidatus Omnitrophica bacterium 4484_70.2]|nr:MAG: hypothetical protein B6D55_02625 [Candidatus Omnitrophica bacterium 4484_70.2]